MLHISERAQSAVDEGGASDVSVSAASGAPASCA
jgi:hypothetical protein